MMTCNTIEIARQNYFCVGYNFLPKCPQGLNFGDFGE